MYYPQILRNNRNIIVLLSILTAALLFRAHNLARYTLWYDEATTVVDNRGLTELHSFGKIFDKKFIIRNHDYLTLYSHGFVYYWRKLFGSSEFSLRFSSVIFALLSIYFLYLLGKQVFGVQVAFMSSLLLAISPLHVYYSQELRQYAAICFFTVLCAYSLTKALNTGRFRYWATFALSSIINIYFHYFMLMLLFSFSVFIFLMRKEYKHRLKGYLLACSVIFICILPLLLVLYPNLLFGLTNKGIPEFNEFPAWGGKVGFQDIMFTVKNFTVGYNLDYYRLPVKIILLIFILAFSTAIWKYRRERMMFLLATALLIPVGTVFLFSYFRPCYVDRYFFNLMPLYLLIVSAGMRQLRRAIFMPVFIAGILFSLYGLKNYYLNYLPGDYKQHVGVQKQDIRGLPDFISLNYQPGDLMLHTCRNTVFPLKFYAGLATKNAGFLDEVDRGRLIFRFHNDARLLFFEYNKRHPITFFTGRHFLLDSELTENTKRLWVIYSSFAFHDTQASEYELIKDLRARFAETFSKKFEGATLYLFSVKR